MKLYYTRRALRSLNSIYEFLREKSNRAAAIIHNEILDEIDKLVLFPQMASVEEELQNRRFEYRSLVVHHTYKVIYRIEEQKIYIVDIWDCRRDPDKLQNNIP